MGRVLTNNVALDAIVESALGEITAPYGFRSVEVNTIGNYGAAITTVTRSPIGTGRQRRKGAITDLTSAVEFEADLTFSLFRDFMEGMMFAVAVNHELSGVHPSGVVPGGYTVTARGKIMKIGHLVNAVGFGVPTNNGLKVLDAALDVNDVLIEIGGAALTAEAAPPANAIVSLAGFRISAGSNPTWTYSALTKRATLAGVAGLGNGLHLTPGQVIHVGSFDDSGDLENSFEDAMNVAKGGFARVVSVAAGTIVFDRLDEDLHANFGATATVVDLLFGEFVRNVQSSHADFVERTYQFRAAFPDLFDVPNADPVAGYEFAKGNFLNTLAMNMPLIEKATANLAFVGTDADSPKRQGMAAGQLAAALVADGLNPIYTSPYNTTSNFARLRMIDVDETGLTTDFKSLTMTINNNVSPEKVLGRLGSRYVNAGNLEINIEGEVIFTSPEVIERIRRNTTVAMDFALRNDNGAIIVDIPSMSLGGGARTFPANESVLASLTAQPFADETLDTSIGISTIPVEIPQQL